MKYAWIVARRERYSTPMMCGLLAVSRSGRRRMTPGVSEMLGRKPNHRRIGRLMREHGLCSRKRRPFRVVTANSRHGHPIAPNVLQRDFVATAPNQKWLADLTHVRTGEGWLYLALVIDLFARKIAGWASSDSMSQELTIEALRVALGWRDPGAGLVHHPDRGSQYAAGDYCKILAARGITVSMTRAVAGITRRWNRSTARSKPVRARRAFPHPRASPLGDRGMYWLLQYRA